MDLILRVGGLIIWSASVLPPTAISQKRMDQIVWNFTPRSGMVWGLCKSNRFLISFKMAAWRHWHWLRVTLRGHTREWDTCCCYGNRYIWFILWLPIDWNMIRLEYDIFYTGSEEQMCWEWLEYDIFYTGPEEQMCWEWLEYDIFYTGPEEQMCWEWLEYDIFYTGSDEQMCWDPKRCLREAGPSLLGAVCWTARQMWNSSETTGRRPARQAHTIPSLTHHPFCHRLV